MDLDHLSSAGTDPQTAVGGDPFAADAHRAPGGRTRVLAGLPAPAPGAIQFGWVFTTISAPSA